MILYKVHFCCPVCCKAVDAVSLMFELPVLHCDACLRERGEAIRMIMTDAEQMPGPHPADVV